MPTVNRNVVELDPREYPEYSISEVASYVDVPESTLSYWARATADESALIVAAGKKEPRFSFFNLLEAHILVSTREREIPLVRVRRAVEHLRQKYPRSRHPLLDHVLWSVHGSRDIFVREVESEDPINATRQGQPAFGAILNKYLKRIETDETGPIRLFPAKSNRIVIDLHVSGGRPVIKGTGVLARMLWSRHQAGDSAKALAKDFKLRLRDVEEAIQYIQSAA